MIMDVKWAHMGLGPLLQSLFFSARSMPDDNEGTRPEAQGPQPMARFARPWTWAKTESLMHASPRSRPLLKLQEFWVKMAHF